ncbi:ADP-ribosylation factor-like protein 5B [Anopheles cruzii]|uniref:ADP-ribosylation factor-like protein 5B n=1 Tax=Anopheles cruzii TaxID=68878 RepID=UPI0022EC7961|nr:ADP-ribosylation factor-like protein 5B [Anopheles cruzii]
MVGLDNADKTTILYQFLMNEVVHTSDRIERGRDRVEEYPLFGVGARRAAKLRAAWSIYYTNTEVGRRPDLP